MSKIGFGAGIALLASAALFASPAMAAQWAVDAATSTLSFEATQTGAAFTGQFKEFTAEIDFDPADPAAGSISATINPASFSSGASDRDGMIGGAEWFDVATFPEAKFVSTGITAGAEAGSYVAAGTLTIKGVDVPVELPFTLAIDGTHAVADGELTLDRLAFGVGTGDWEDDSVVSTAVKVLVHIEADTI